MGRILKRLALAAGAGLVLGFSATAGGARNSGQARPRRRSPSAPLLPDGDAPGRDVSEARLLRERLDLLANRLDTLEAHGPPDTAPDAPLPVAGLSAPSSDSVEINELLARQDAEVRQLRERVAEAERRAAAAREMLELEARRLREEIPALVRSHVADQLGAMQGYLAAEIEETRRRTIEGFERTVNEKLSARLVSLENSVIEQGTSVVALGERASQHDVNLQRLLGVIERLFSHSQQPEQSAAAAVGGSAFQAHLEEAMEAAPEPGPEAADSAARPSRSSEPPRRPRFPMARTL